MGTTPHVAEQSLTRPTRPPAAEFHNNIPTELKNLRRWLVWRWAERPNANGKFAKIPYNIADRKAHFTSPAEWLPFETAVRQYQRGNYDGIGIVLGDRLSGLDIDHCYCDGQLDAEAASHLRLLHTYAERSVSGDGVHALAFGTLPDGPRKRGNYEMYSDRRFFVVTGWNLDGAPAHVMHQERELCTVHAMIFGNRQSASTAWSVTQIEANTQGGGRGELKQQTQKNNISDSQVIGMLKRDCVAWRYWLGDLAGKNPSEADFALAAKLAFYTGRNLEQMDRLFRKSGLYNRAKDTSGRGSVDYTRYTLQRACQRQKAIWWPTARAARKSTPRGSPLSNTTRAVLALATQNPGLTPAQIARRLALKPGTVRVILYRHQPDRNALRRRGKAA